MPIPPGQEIKENPMQKTAAKYRRQLTGALMFAVIVGVAVVSITKISKASVGNISKADLAGSWQIALITTGGGCGNGTILATFTLNASGAATNGVEKSHSAGCSDGTVTGQTLTISALNTSGSGTAGMSCGANCGYTFAIQVSPDRG